MHTRHFIPFRKSDIIAMCLQDGDFDSHMQIEFQHFCTLLQSVFHRLGLLDAKAGGWGVAPPAESSAILDRRWHQYFSDGNL